MEKLKSLILLTTTFFFFSTPAFSAEVAVSIPPVYSVVKAITEGTDIKVGLIVGENKTIHGYRLKPSEILKLKRSDLTVIIHPLLERFMVKALRGVNSDKVLRLADHSKTVLPIRHDDDFEIFADHGAHDDHNHGMDKMSGKKKHGHEEHGHEEHEHEEHQERDHDEHGHEEHEHEEHEHEEHGHEEHGHGINDYHMWLNPENVLAYAEVIHARLVRLSPKNKKALDANLAGFNAAVNTQIADLKAKFSATKLNRMVAFHDAYQYFENYFGIRIQGVLLIDPEIPLSGTRLVELREALEKNPPHCLYSEPQYNPKSVETFAKKFNLKVFSLDPLGGGNMSAAGYPGFLKAMGSAFLECADS